MSLGPSIVPVTSVRRHIAPEIAKTKGECGQQSTEHSHDNGCQDSGSDESDMSLILQACIPKV